MARHTNAKVAISDSVSGLRREATTNGFGEFRFVNVPFNPYHLVVISGKFAPYAQDIELRSAIPLILPISLNIRY